MSRPGFARLSSIETLDPDRLSDRHSRQSDTSSGAEQLRRTRSRWRRVRLLTVLLSRDSRLSHVVVGERYRSTARRLRLIHAAKTGAATLLAASVSLIDPFERATNGTGVWCVITTLIVMQSQTLGGTTHKTVNRVIGTVAAAIAALAAGFVANVLETAHRSLAAVFVGGCVFAATGAATFLAGSKSWALWSYAFFLTALTFDFLLLLEYRDDFTSGVYRIAMILAGAVIAVCVSAAPPKILASNELRGILADNLLDAADAARRVVDAFCSGARLHRISEIYDDDYPEIECDLHASYQQIIHSRPAYEAAVSAASWEEWELRRGGDWEPFRDVGIHMRRFVYSVVSLDEYARHPLPGGAASSRAHFSALLAGPLTELTLAISALLRSLAATVRDGPRALALSADVGAVAGGGMAGGGEAGEGGGQGHIAGPTRRASSGCLAWVVRVVGAGGGGRGSSGGRSGSGGEGGGGGDEGGDEGGSDAGGSTRAEAQQQAAAAVERAAAALTQQLATFCRDAMVDLPDEEALWMATFVAFVRQSADAARRALQLHRSTDAAMRGIDGGGTAAGIAEAGTSSTAEDAVDAV